MEKVLLIDDEPNVLNAFKRRLSSSYEVAIATSASGAMEQLKAAPQTAVIVSDMYMPGVQGVELLKEVAHRYPDCTRVMLTGMADQKTAVRAINDGAVFKFLTKPVSVEELEKVIEQSIEHRALVLQERDLLQNTLGGVVRLLNDLLSFIDPDGIARATRQRAHIRELGTLLSISTIEAELAALLAGIGRFALPLEILLKMAQGEPLTPLESHALEGAPATSSRLLRQIPRFEKISQILDAANQQQTPKDKGLRTLVALYTVTSKVADTAPEAKSALQVVSAPDFTLTEPEREALAPILVHRGGAASATATQEVSYQIHVRELCPGQRLLADVTDRNGKLLLRKGFQISPAVVARVKNHHELVGVSEPIIVNARIPAREDS